MIAVLAFTALVAIVTVVAVAEWLHEREADRNWSEHWRGPRR